MQEMQWRDVRGSGRSSAKKSTQPEAVFWREQTAESHSGGQGATLDAYAVLDVARDAAQMEIRRAYRSQMEKFHPDRQPEHLRLWAGERARQINAAYALLRDAARRAAYDDACRIHWKHDASL
jgi:DnaJ-domain-containing protein 1